MSTLSYKLYICQLLKNVVTTTGCRLTGVGQRCMWLMLLLIRQQTGDILSFCGQTPSQLLNEVTFITARFCPLKSKLLAKCHLKRGYYIYRHD
jgi:hypothetical protein